MGTEVLPSLSGANRIAGREVEGTGRIVRGVDPHTGSPLPVEFRDAGSVQVDAALEAALGSRASLQDRTRRGRALELVAEALLEDQPSLAAIAEVETGLPAARLDGEVVRAADQFRAFARVVREGAYLEAHIDRATQSSPDLRRLLHPLGPVVVFGASNFPFAFSVAGGDTASALAAGCPVVVKAHPAHPGTSELSARSIERGLAEADVDLGVFSMLHGADPSVGGALVTHPHTRAVGFTGSLRAGRALMDLAAARPDPIPVYAEMGSVNPAFVTPAAIAARGQELAATLAGSVTLGMGQFCTKPGLLVIPKDAVDFEGELVEAMTGVQLHPMLSGPIRDAFRTGLDQTAEVDGVEDLLPLRRLAGDGFVQPPVLLATDLETLRSRDILREERFGPFCLVVRAELAEYVEVAALLPGSLVASIFAEPSDDPRLEDLHRCLEERCGRIVYDGVSTGVAVSPAMQHGGPYPAASTAMFSSVGDTAIRRFLRPVAYQNARVPVLPDELRDRPSAPLWRTVDGQLTRDGICS